MVRYVGRARTTMTTMSTNQVGLKMSGCPSRVGRKGATIRSFNNRVNCMQGLCGGARMNGQIWKTTERNRPPFCIKPATKCAQAAGGVGRINAPYFNRKVRAGESGCTPAPASLVTTTTTTTTFIVPMVEHLIHGGLTSDPIPPPALVNGSVLYRLEFGDDSTIMTFDSVPQFTYVTINYDGQNITFYANQSVSGSANPLEWPNDSFAPTGIGNATLTFTY